MAYEMKGTVKVIGEVQTFGSSFTKREIVITTSDDKYPQDIRMDAIKDRTALLDDFKVGDPVKVSFDIRGREYNGRYFVDLSVWKIEAAGGPGQSSKAAEPEDTTDYSTEQDPPF